eukprot:COSAG05_NODE_11_length_38500_cov_831.349861_8_plen_79_part_00
MQCAHGYNQYVGKYQSCMVEISRRLIGKISAVCKACITGSKLSDPKGRRKGHPFVFRLDLAEADNGGGLKYDLFPYNP